MSVCVATPAQPSSGLASPPAATAATDVDGSILSPQQQEALASITPVRTSVTLLSTRVRNSALLHASLSKLQSLLPTPVTSEAVRRAHQLSELGRQLGDPLVSKVDGNLASALIALSKLPAYGSAKIGAADELAYSYTPSALKPTYTATRQRVSDVVTSASARVQRVAKERGVHINTQALWLALNSKVEQISAQLAALRESVATHSHTAVERLAALHLTNHLQTLQGLLAQAVELARTKGHQAQQLSVELRSALLDATSSVSAYIDSNLSESYREALLVAWNKIQEGVSSMRETLQSVRANMSNHSSRSNSEASAQVVDAEKDVCVADAVDAEPSQAEVEQHSNGSSSNGNGMNGHGDAAGLRQRSGKKSHHNNKHGNGNKRSSKREEEEEKSKINDEQRVE